jgi:hypothetical protein
LVGKVKLNLEAYIDSNTMKNPSRGAAKPFDLDAKIVKRVRNSSLIVMKGFRGSSIHVTAS